MEFPNISPVAFSIGPLDVRWYGISYILGIVITFLIAQRLSKREHSLISPNHVMDFFTPCIFAIIIGGRLGFVLFYFPLYYIENPLEIFAVWKGGMSFHGATIALTLLAIWFSIRRKLPMLAFFDAIVPFTPIGIFFGRIANFINAEHWGRVTDSRFGMIFPNAGPLPRHPSQIYEALTEGLFLFIILILISTLTRARFYLGLQSGLFLIGYGVARTIMELYREPDEVFLLPFDIIITIGQLLSIPMIIAGIIICFYAIAFRKQTIPNNNNDNK